MQILSLNKLFKKLGIVFLILFSFVSNRANAQVKSFKYGTKAYTLGVNLPLTTTIKPEINGNVSTAQYLKKYKTLNNLGDIIDYYIDKRTENVYVHYRKFKKVTVTNDPNSYGPYDTYSTTDEKIVYYEKGKLTPNVIATYIPSNFGHTFNVIQSFIVLDNGDVIYAVKAGTDISVKKYSFVTKQTSLLAGSIKGDSDGTGGSAKFDDIKSIVLNAKTNEVLIDDAGNNKIKSISLTTGVVNTVLRLVDMGEIQNLIYSEKEDCYYYLLKSVIDGDQFYTLQKTSNGSWVSTLQNINNYDTRNRLSDLVVNKDGDIYVVNYDFKDLGAGASWFYDGEVRKLNKNSNGGWIISGSVFIGCRSCTNNLNNITGVSNSPVRSTLGFLFEYPSLDLNSNARQQNSHSYHFLTNNENLFFITGKENTYDIIENYKQIFTVYPTLPVGLSMNEYGVISGTPTQITEPKNYIISFPDSVGNWMKDTLNIGVLAQPVVSTNEVSNVTKVSATSGGNVTVQGAGAVTERGIVWGTSASPTYELNSKVISGSGLGAFPVTMNSLTNNTSYFVRAFAVNSAGVGYGQEIKFSTNIAPVINSNGGTLSATISLQENNSLIATISATDDDSGQTITYSLSNVNQDASLININPATGALSFINTPDFENPLDSGKNNIYNFQVIATDNGNYNKSDTQAISILINDITENPTIVSPITKLTGVIGAKIGANIINDGGGGVITERGFVYALTSANGNPIIGGTGVTKVAQTGKLGAFEETLNSLTLSSAYTFKAYAINATGTGYSDAVTFSTLGANSAPLINYTGQKTFLANAAITSFAPEQLGGAIAENIYGKVSTFAGIIGTTATNGIVNATGNAAKFNGPMGMAKDAAGNIYVADRDNFVIRKVTSAGIVSTFAGTAGSYGAVDGVGTAAKFNLPEDIVIDAAGLNLYVSDRGSHKIRKIEISTATVTTIAGGASWGSADNFVDGLQASFNYPAGMTIDANGNLLVADFANNKVRKLSPVVSNIDASTNKSLNFDGTNDFVTLGNEAAFDFTNNMTVEAWVKIPAFTKAYQTLIAKGDRTWSIIRNNNNNNIAFAIYYNSTTSIAAYGSKLMNDNKWHHIAGVVKGDSVLLYIDGVLDGVATRPGLMINTTDIAVTIGENLQALGRQFNGSFDEVRIWSKARSLNELKADMFKSVPANSTNLVAYYNFDQGTAGGTNTGLTNLNNSSTSSSSSLLNVGTLSNFALSGTSSNFVAGFTPASWSVVTVAGSGTSGGTNNKPKLATFNGPQDVAVDASGAIFVAEAGGHKIRKIAADTVVTFAGSGTYGTVDGKGILAQFNQPFGLAFDGTGKLYVAESEGNKIRVIDTAGMVSTFAGTGISGAKDSSILYSSFRKPRGLLFDPAGYLYLSDYEYDKIRKINISGYEISHQLPLGLSLDTATAVISGTPTDYTYKTVYNNNFGSGINVKDTLYTDASVTGEYIRLTPAINAKYGAFKINASGNNASRHKVNFKLITTKAAGANGLSYSFGDDVNSTLISTSFIQLAEFGSGTKLSITFASSGTKGVRLLWNPTKIGTLSTIIDTNTLAYSNNTAWIGKQSDVKMVIDENAKLTLLIDGVTVFNQVQLPLAFINANKSTWEHMFKARTTTTNDLHGIDNVVIEEGYGASKYDITAHNYYGDYTYQLGLTVGDKPTLTTKNAGNITYSYAKLSGNITNDGGDKMSEVGICWSTNANPTIADSKMRYYFPIAPPSAQILNTFAISQLGIYDVYVTGLTSATQYYARAYATNVYGTSYGNEIIFTTKMAPPEISYANRSYTVKKGDAITPITLSNSGSPILRSTYGAVRTLAGRSAAGAAGDDDGDALNSAEFSDPNQIHISKDGNLYIADNGTDAIRKITPAGEVSTLARELGYLDGTVKYRKINGMTSDESGNLFVTIGTKVRKISPAGVISDFAGGGNNFNGQGILAKFVNPQGIVTDMNGDMFVADIMTHSIRKITRSGLVTTFAGDNVNSGMTNGPTKTSAGLNFALFKFPKNLIIDAMGNLLVTENGNYTIRKITPDGIVSKLVTPNFSEITGFTIDNLGNIYLDFPGYSSVLKFDFNERLGTYNVSNFAGEQMGAPGFSDGLVNDARFKYPSGLAYNTTTNEIIVADAGNNKIRAIGLSGYSISPETLPSGLMFNKDNGEITGTPIDVFLPQTYIITARNAGGIDTTIISLSVNLTGGVTLPSVTTNGVPEFASKSANASGSIVSDGGGLITESGYVYSTSTNPTLANASKALGTTNRVGPLTVLLSGLTPSTTYYVKAFATNSMGTVYGVEKSFTTLPPGIDPPQIALANEKYIWTVGVTITPLRPTSSGGDVTSYSILPDLPAGLIFNAVTGEISGTPIEMTDYLQYRITARNTSGFDSKSFFIEVDARANATITLADITKPYGASNFTLAATSNSTGNITYASSNTNVAKINGAIVTIIGSGTTSITVNQVASDNYNAATTSAVLTVIDQTPVITLASIIKKYGNGVFTIGATSTSAGVLSYTSSNLNVATIVGDQVTIVGAGETTITVDQAAAGGYEVGQTTSLLTVDKADQKITMAPLPTTAPLKDLSNVQLTATASSGLPVVISLDPTSVATLNTSVTPYELASLNSSSTGSVIVNATQAGNDNYNAAEISQSFDVTKNNQTLTFAALTAVTYSPSGTVSLSATTTAISATTSATLDVSFTIENGPATISDNILTVTGAGKIIVKASQDGDDTHNAANPVYRELIVSKAASIISLANITKNFGDAEFDLALTSSSDGAVYYTSSDPSIARIMDKTVQIIATGTVTITATQIANDTYEAATTTGTLVIDKIDPALTLPASISKRLEQSNIDIAATSKSNAPITYTSSDPLIASIIGNVVTFNGTGSVVITATQAADDNFNTATTSADLYIEGYVSTTITLGAISKVYGESDFAITPVGNSTGSITYTSSDLNIANITGDIISISGVGDVVISAMQESDGIHAPITSSFSLSVTKATLTVTADNKTKVYGDANPALTISYTGFKGTDNVTSLTTSSTISTTATTTSGAGVYSITVEGAVSNNYDFVYAPGILTVNKATITFTAQDSARCYGVADPALSYSVSGFVNGEDSTVIITKPTVATNALSSSVAGDYKTIASGAAATNYDFVYVDGKFTVNPLPTGTITSSVDFVCDGATLALNIAGGSNYVWYKGGTVIADATGLSVVVNSKGDYTAKLISALGCEAMSTNTLAIKQYYAPTADFTSQYYCINKPVYMTNKSTSATAGPVKYLWEDGAGYTSTATSPTFTYTSTGTKTIKLTVTPDYCPALKQTVSKVVAIEAPTAPVRLATQDAIVREAFQLNTRSITTATSYLWSPSIYLLDARILAPTAVIEKETNFTLLTTVASSCTTTDSLLVRVFTESDIHLPTVFSPNGDGLNDKLQLNFALVENLQWFRVYDRFNTLVFETKDKLGSWDGTFNNSGTPLPVDTYFWVVSGTDNNGKAINKTGAIVLSK